MANKRVSFRARLALALLVLAAVFGVWFYYNCPVAKVVPVARGTAVDAVPGSVIVDAKYDMDLKSELGGRIVKSALDEGKHVKKDQFLVQLDTGDLALQIEKQEIDHEALKKRLAVGSQIELGLANARTAFADAEHQHQLGQLSDNDLAAQRRSLESVEQQFKLEQISNQNLLDTDDNTLKSERRQLAKMTVTAPFDSVISEVLVHPGDLIGAGAPLATLIATERKVEGRISEENFAGIRVGQKAIVRFLTYGDKTFSATVSKILPTADSATQRYVVYLDVDLPLEQLVPGLTGEVSITVGEHADALIVPRRALFGTNLFIVRHGHVRLRNVSVGYVGINEAEILDGVDEGDLVIVDDLDRFRAGDRVRATPVAP